MNKDSARANTRYWTEVTVSDFDIVISYQQ